MGCGVPQSARLQFTGGDREEAIANIKEAIELYIETLLDDGMAIPEDHLDRMMVVV